MGLIDGPLHCCAVSIHVVRGSALARGYNTAGRDAVRPLWRSKTHTSRTGHRTQHLSELSRQGREAENVKRLSERDMDRERE